MTKSRVRSAPPSMQAYARWFVSTTPVISPPSLHAQALVGEGVGDPHVTVGVEADAVRRDEVELRPHAAIGERAVGGDVKGAQAKGHRLSDDERRAVGCDDAAVGKGHVGDDLDDGAGRIEHDEVGRRRGSGHHARRPEVAHHDVEVEAEVADVGESRRPRRPCRSPRTRSRARYREERARRRRDGA